MLPPDADEDGVVDADDNCPNAYNPEQIDTDRDGIGDRCDEPSNATGGTGGTTVGTSDFDEDGVADSEDNHPCVYNADQQPVENDTLGTSCLDDSALERPAVTAVAIQMAEETGVAWHGFRRQPTGTRMAFPDSEDNHPCLYNPEQSPMINDTVGTSCIDGSGSASGGTAGTDTNPGGSAGDGNGNDNQPIADFDEDGIPDGEDNHPCVFNEDQAPVANDTQGTSCIDGSTSTGGTGGDGGQGAVGGDEGGTSGAIEAPADWDEDDVPDSEDNHPCQYNPDQAPVAK